MAIRKISIAAIKRIGVDLLAQANETMRAAIFGALSTFTGTKPFTSIEVIAITDAYIAARTAFILGGVSQKKDYDTATTNIINCMLLFAKYINDLAVGDMSILELTGLPITGTINNTAQLIIDGGVATGLAFTMGGPGKLSTTCAVFGLNANYIALLVDGDLLPVDATTSLDGQIPLPSSTTTYYMNVNGQRNKTFTNLPAGKFFWLYYLLMFGGVVSAYSVPIKVASGA